MKQFGRQYRLAISSIQEGLGLEVSSLRVAFEITKSIDEKPNPAKIVIWNLQRDHINRLLAGKFSQVKLWAGYEDLRLIYQGDIIKTQIRRDGVDFLLEIESGDGYKDNQAARLHTTLKSGATLSDVVTAVAGTLSASIGTIALPRDQPMPRAQVFHGATRNVLNQLAFDQAANWSIQDGELIFLPYDSVLSGDVPLLSQESGLVGFPEQTDNGLVLQCLLNPELRIGGLVRLVSILPYFDGEYKIVHLSHVGDALSGDWLSRLTVVGGQFQPVGSTQ